MKKLVSLLLIMVMMFSLVACGAKEEVVETTTAAATTAGSTEEAKTLEASITVQAETSWLEYYQAAVARVIAKHPNAKIDIIEVGSFDHLDTIDKTDITNSDVADVFALPADRIYGLAQNEVLATIDAMAMAANVGGFADYDAGLGGNFKVDGDYLAFPMNIETLINFVNTANAAASNVDLSGSIEFTTLNPESMLVPVFNAWFGVALANAGNIEMLGKNEDGSLFSDLTVDWADLPAEKQAVFTSLFNYWKAHDTAKTSLWDSSAAWGYMDTAFTTGGQTSIRLEGPWSSGSLSNLAGAGADLEILPINQVTLNGAPLAHWKGGWGLGINARIEGEEDQMLLAQALIEEIMNTDFAVDFYKGLGKIMENVDPSVYANSDMPEIDKKIVAAVIESYQDAPARPLFTEWGQVWGTWETGLLSWAAVKPATVEAAYAEVQASFKAMMLNF
ncbi:MAG TPA: sugar ABC transporter substrate-binding protein [Clostridiales bacterium UBA8960]|nr:sugar ABC transporter substrate-binding protein [Clostridiales bacterium UBA8960]